VGGDATASAAAGLGPVPAGGDAAGPGGGPTLLGALAAFFRVLGDTLRILLRLLLVEPLSWVLNRSGLLAIRAADLVQQLERANALAPLDPDRLAGALRVLNKHAPEATVDFVERRCLASGGASGGGGGGTASFAVNSAVVREYLAALVKTGRLARYGDSPDATPGEGQSHRSLPQLLAELQAAAGGEALRAEPGASLARPLHVVVQAQVGWAADSAKQATCMASCRCLLSLLSVSSGRVLPTHTSACTSLLQPRSYSPAACATQRRFSGPTPGPHPRPPLCAGEGGGRALLAVQLLLVLPGRGGSHVCGHRGRRHRAPPAGRLQPAGGAAGRGQLGGGHLGRQLHVCGQRVQQGGLLGGCFMVCGCLCTKKGEKSSRHVSICTNAVCCLRAAGI
jgi:hypothetical protein